MKTKQLINLLLIHKKYMKFHPLFSHKHLMLKIKVIKNLHKSNQNYKNLIGKKQIGWMQNSNL